MLGKGPEAKLPTQMSLPSPSGFRQCDAQTLAWKRRGDGAFGSLASRLLSESLIYFHGFVASAPASLRKQRFLVKRTCIF